MVLLVIQCNDDVSDSPSTPSLPALLQGERERESAGESGSGAAAASGAEPPACVPIKVHAKRFMGGYWAANKLMELFPRGGRVSVSGKVRDAKP